MLEHLRQQVSAALASAQTVVLSTWGPAGLQAATLPCQSIETRLYFTIPRTSDLLFNIEQQPEVLVTAAAWQLRGRARVLPPGECPGGLALGRSPMAAWGELVELCATQLAILPASEGSRCETIDIW